MMLKENQAEDALVEFKRALASARDAAGQASEDELRQAAQAGEALVVTAPRLKADGVVYAPGDTIQLDPTSRLLVEAREPAGRRVRYVNTQARYEASQRAAELEKLDRDVIGPLNVTRGQAQGQLSRAERDVYNAQQALQRAMDAADAARARLERADADLVATVEAAME